MAQADYEDTPEIAMTRAWRMGENARRLISDMRDEMTAAGDDRRPECELRALIAHQARLLSVVLDEAKWAAHVAVYGAFSDAAA